MGGQLFFPWAMTCYDHPGNQACLRQHDRGHAQQAQPGFKAFQEQLHR